MEITNLINRVAGNESPLKGEAVKAARHILDKNKVQEFMDYAFSYEGADKSWPDFRDCILDFFCGIQIQRV